MSQDKASFCLQLRKQNLTILEKIPFLLPPKVSFASYMKRHFGHLAQDVINSTSSTSLIAQIFEHFELDFEEEIDDRRCLRASPVDVNKQASNSNDKPQKAPSEDPRPCASLGQNRNLVKALKKLHSTEAESEACQSVTAEDDVSSTETNPHEMLESRRKNNAEKESQKSASKAIDGLPTFSVGAKIPSRNPFLSKAGGRSSFQFGHFTSKMANMNQLFRQTKHPTKARPNSPKRKSLNALSKPTKDAKADGVLNNASARTDTYIQCTQEGNERNTSMSSPAKKQKMDYVRISETPLKSGASSSFSFVGETPHMGTHETPPRRKNPMDTSRHQLLSPMVPFAFSQDNTPFKIPTKASSLVAEVALAATRKNKGDSHY
jgi:hypothetical protein